MKNISLSILLLLWSMESCARALVDADVLLSMKVTNNHGLITNLRSPAKTGLLIFGESPQQLQNLQRRINHFPGSKAHMLSCMPALLAFIPKESALLNKIAEDKAVRQISSYQKSTEELEMSEEAILMRPSAVYPNVSNWWQAGYNGHSGVAGIIDSGIAVEHPGLLGKKIIVHNAPGSDYNRYKNGVHTPHATGVACIYAGIGSASFPDDIGIAYGLPVILSGYATESGNETVDISSTLSTLDWMLTEAPVQPTVINYSFGNGDIACPACTDWSGMAKIVDYVVNHKKILWVKSAGNKGFPNLVHTPTLTSPADNYNGLTIANMNPTIRLQDGEFLQTADRSLHAITYTSSRGPTLFGRRKPDISAPGNDTRTCAPDSSTYGFVYKPAMDYHDGYRLMGGTSSAAPHVGAAVLLLQDAGIKDPMCAKALLINSADAWTDSGLPGPNDPYHPYQGGHFAVMGSEWSPTYGWGYLNMQQAFEQRANLLTDSLSPNMAVKEYRVSLPLGGKVTLVHERRVGYRADNTPWQLSHLSLALYDADTETLIANDNSPIDTVHQVANCVRGRGEKICTNDNKIIHAIIRVTLVGSTIDGSDEEPFAIAYG